MPWFLQGFPGKPVCEGALSSDACACLSLPRAISCILDIWLEYYQEDFHQLPEFSSLTKLLEFKRQRMPGSDRAWRYLKLFRHLHAIEPEARGEEDWGWLSLGPGGLHRSSFRAAVPGEVGSLTPPSPRAAFWGDLPGLLHSHTLSGRKSVLDLGGTWKVYPGDDTLSSWSYSFGPRTTP